MHDKKQWPQPGTKKTKAFLRPGIDVNDIRSHIQVHRFMHSTSTVLEEVQCYDVFFHI